jgi:hypothetical protein
VEDLEQVVLYKSLHAALPFNLFKCLIRNGNFFQNGLVVGLADDHVQC